ncbi:hypothetical protein EI555_013760 [Monodon monoceros]|uniref:Uncharacterized protein n=1 Tax=Monodon monoceros TaxID=40151 RepID=A0A4U1FKU8_MONMO|nr:hypothetical protein EI555_013760 [Monodon monoceros]
MAAAGTRHLLARSSVAALSLPQGTRCLGVMHTRQDCDIKDYRKIRTVVIRKRHFAGLLGHFTVRRRLQSQASRV